MRAFHRTPRKTVACTVLLLAVFVTFSTHTALAQVTGQFVPLAGIPGISSGSNTSLPSYLNALYALLIAIGALIAVVKIAAAGAQYAMSDVITKKEDAKKDIYGALLGLAILLLPYVILSTINPTLVNLDILKSAPKINQPLQDPLPIGIISPPVTVPNGITNDERAAFIKKADDECSKKGGVPVSTAGSTQGTITCLAPTETQATNALSSLKNGGTAVFRPATDADERKYMEQIRQACGGPNKAIRINQSGNYQQNNRAIEWKCQ